jgi:hypothetical protein
VRSGIFRSWQGAPLALGTVVVLALSGCGGSSSDDSSVQQQIEQARKQGAAAAHRQERIAELQRRVAHLEHKTQGKEGSTTSPQRSPAVGASPTGGASDPSVPIRTFHSPSNNVSCEILREGALCSVISNDATFVLDQGEVARIEAGTAVPQGAGELAPYGSTVSEGTIVCTLPASGDARGVVCSDSSTGHGFQASRVESRQHTF